MNFLAPLLLAGLAAVAVPIVLHLLQRERHDVLEFPSLMFLRQIPQETTKRRRLRHWLLLAARCLLLALIAFAFARPFLRGRAAAVAGREGAREVVVLVDRSASMGYEGRWARAQAAARSVIDGLDGDDHLTLVLFDAGAEALNERTSDRAALGALVAQARPGAGATRYGPALRLAQGVLEEAGRARGEVVVVSDFQQAGWDGAPDVRLPAGTTLRRVSVADGATANAAVAAVDVTRGTAAAAAGAATRGTGAAAAEQVTITARVRNLAAEPALGRQVQLELNGRVLQTQSVDLPAAGIVPVRFDPVPLPPEASRGVVRLAADGLAADDAHHFVVSRAQVRPVLVIEAQGAPPGTSLYLTRALSLARDPGYAVTVRQLPAVRPADVASAALVVLNDVAPPGGDIGRRLAERVRGGAGVLVALGERSGSSWTGPLAELAPLTLGDARDRRDPGGAALGYVERTHPVFMPFRGGRGGDFAAARIFRYRDVRPAEGATVLARHGDGSVALAEMPAGRGRVLVWASALDNRWSDLPVQPVFLPLVHELARYASGQPTTTPALVVGQSVDVASYAALHGGAAADSAATGGAAGQWLAIAPSGERVRLDGAQGLALTPREAGFYQVRALSGGTRTQPLAVNVDPAESDLTPLDSAAFVVASADASVAAGATAATRSPVEEEARQSLWWYLLAGALLLLGAEAAYANRLAVRTR